MATEYGNRLRIARKKAGLTQIELSKVTGIAQSTISTAEREGYGSGETPVYAKVCGVSALWLATGEGPMEPVTATANITLPGFTVTATGSNQAPALIGRAGRAIELIDLENNPDYPAIRRVNITAKAGVTGYAVDYIDEARPPIFFRRDWYESKGYRPDRMIAIRVSGESMIPSLFDGDLIVINTEQKQPKQGVAFLVSFEGEVVVKRLVRDDGQWWLTSDNPDQRRYPRVKCNGGTEIIGEVVYRQTEQI